MNSNNRKNRIDRVLKNKQPTLELFLDDIHDPHNLSAILRTSDAVGVMRVNYTNKENQELKIHKKITQGTQRWVENNKIHDDKKVEFLKEKKEQGFEIIATHLDENSIPFREIDFTKKTIIVVGNEKDGVSKEVLNIADKTIIIPMKGMVQSLNVSVATSLILYEAQNQLQKIGRYDKPQLDEKTREEIKRRWIYRDTIARRSKGVISMPPA